MSESPDWAKIRTGLSAVLPDAAIKTVKKRGGKPLSYITARTVMDLLDDVVGPENWRDEYETINHATGAVQCTLTVHGIHKSDVGYPNNPIGSTDSKGNPMSDEPLKDAFSDALKRAAVHWGIGRFLYEEPLARPDDGEGVTATEAKAPETGTTSLTPDRQEAAKRLNTAAGALAKDMGKSPQVVMREAISNVVSREIKVMGDLSLEEIAQATEWIETQQTLRKNNQDALAPAEIVIE